MARDVRTLLVGVSHAALGNRAIRHDRDHASGARHFTGTWESSELSTSIVNFLYAPNQWVEHRRHISAALGNRTNRHGRDHAPGALQTPTFHRHLRIEQTIIPVVVRPLHTKRLHFTHI